MSDRLLTPEEINACYDLAHERWEKDGKTEVYEFAFLWQYIAYEVVKAKRNMTAVTVRAETLKEVGEWLERHGFYFDDFKQGRMPE